MNSQRYAQLNDLFGQVCDLSGDDRARTIDELCGEDESLRVDLQRLLAAHDDSPDSPASPVNGVAEVDLPSEVAGYSITGLLGVGGMGVVYRAQQRQPAREVALKVLHAGLHSASVRRRFQLEAEVLGRLHHPGIAQIHEAGEWTSEGRRRPFFAMELVDGQPVTEFSRRHALDTRAMLELLAAICDAVGHAHQKGVIHRDLKPGNILVEGSGRPKILDFGVARAVDSDIRVTTQRTDVGQLIGTVAYMSPEQAAGDPGAIDHRSDVYALGVIMYELLAGEPPLNLHERSLPDAVRAIRDDDPAPLSAIDRRFRGDLETIVSKAMEKDQARRYQTAAALAADVRRYLGDEPIAARAPSTLYQIGKFSRRHKGLVGGLAAAILILFAATAFSSWMAWREHQAGLQAKSNADAASRQADRAERVKDLMIGMFAPVYPMRPDGKVTVQDMLAQATERVRTGLRDQPDIADEMYFVLGTIYHNLDLPQYAAPLLEELLARQKASGASPATYVGTIDVLADAYNRDRDYEQSAKYHRELLEIHRAAGPWNSVPAIDALNGLAHVLTLGGHPDEGLSLRTEALALLDQDPAPRPYQRAAAQLGIAAAYIALHRYAEAETATREYLAGPRFVGTFWAQYYLAQALAYQGKVDKALLMLEQMAPSAREHADGEPRRLGILLTLYSETLERNGDLNQAEAVAREAVSVLESLDAAVRALALRQLASTLHQQGRTTEALDVVQQAVLTVRVASRNSEDEAEIHALKARIEAAIAKASQPKAP
jgi:tetratricopeptide (TPR) repeat protein